MSTRPEFRIQRSSGEFHPTRPLEYRIALVGKTGEGKSATANTIFGHKVFKSIGYSKSETKKCQSVKDTVFERNLLVVDTPGFFDTESSHDETEKEILTFFALTSPGPHILLLVMKIQRGTPEFQDSYARLCKLLGNKGQPYTIIVFTGGDDLDADEITIEEYVQNATAGVKKMLVESGHRYVVFNNRLKGKEREDQVNKLIKKIDALVEVNDGGVLSSELYYTAEEALLLKEKKEREALMKKKEAEESQLNERRQKDIESFKPIRTRTREYERKITKRDQEYEEDRKTLEYRYGMKLVQVRDETRKQINEDTVNVSATWFAKTFKHIWKI